MKIPSFSYLSDGFMNAAKRFPLAMLAAFTGVVALLIIIEKSSANYDESMLIKTVLTASLGLPLFLCAHIVAEKWQLTGFKKWLPVIVVAVQLLGYFMMIQVTKDQVSETVMIQFAGLNLVAHLMVAFLPYLDATPVEDFWEYNKQLFGNFMVGAFYSLVIFAGLGIAILAVDNLFDLNIDGKIYGHLFVIVAGIFNTSFFLSNFPKEYAGLSQDASTYTVAFKNLSKYILIPIVAIYFLILYAYSGKILVEWELPHGWVGSLVLGFSIAGIFTYLLNYLLVKFDDSALVSGYRRWFFFILLPMVALLFVAIGRRLGDYGVTEPRFIVAAAGVWLALTSLYFIISKKDNIKFIPISLAVFALLTVLGPFNAFKVSRNDQAERLQSLLEKHGMFEDGKAVAAKDSIPQADANSISSILNYMRERGYFKTVAPWFPGTPDVESPDWSDVDKIIQYLNISYSGVSPNTTCGFYFPRNRNVDVAGYEQLVWVNLDQYTTSGEDSVSWILAKDRTAFEYLEDGEMQERFDLQLYLAEMAKKYGCNKDSYDAKDAILVLNGTKMELMLVIENLTWEKDEPIKVNNLNGILLFRKKK